MGRLEKELPYRCFKKGKDMSYKLNKKLADLVPYDPITGTYKIRLDANESCFNLSDSLKEKICRSISEVSFNRYPDCLAEKPVKAFSQLYGVSPELVTAGNGSDELISIITGCFFESGDTIVDVSNDFSMYGFYAQLYELKVATYQKEADLTISPEKLIEFCRSSNAKGLIFSNPCNPTSLGLDRASVRKIIEGLPDCLVILDEAYMDFWDQSLLGEIDNYDNLIILKTCSKAIGLAAVRFGFAVANKVITTAMRAAKSPYNNDSVAQAIVSDILAEKEYLNKCREVIIANTRSLYDSITALNEKYKAFDEVYKPCTNFVYIKTDKFQDIYEFMLENSIAIRKFNGYLRVTAGTEAENAEFMAVLEKYLSR
jgi:histidinol-phosphate aminotransferase